MYIMITGKDISGSVTSVYIPNCNPARIGNTILQDLPHSEFLTLRYVSDQEYAKAKKRALTDDDIDPVKIDDIYDVDDITTLFERVKQLEIRARICQAETDHK